MKLHFPVNIKHLDAPTGIKKCICFIESKDKLTKIQCPEVNELLKSVSNMNMQNKYAFSTYRNMKLYRKWEQKNVLYTAMTKHFR